MNNYIVDNCVISKIYSNGTRICKISFYEKYYGNTSAFQVIKTGSRGSDNKLISDIAEGTIDFEYLHSIN
jgi:hypothetical protein